MCITTVYVNTYDINVHDNILSVKKSLRPGFITLCIVNGAVHSLKTILVVRSDHHPLQTGFLNVLFVQGNAEKNLNDTNIHLLAQSYDGDPNAVFFCSGSLV